MACCCDGRKGEVAVVAAGLAVDGKAETEERNIEKGSDAGGAGWCPSQQWDSLGDCGRFVKHVAGFGEGGGMGPIEGL